MTFQKSPENLQMPQAGFREIICSSGSALERLFVAPVRLEKLSNTTARGLREIVIAQKRFC
jgi:hypothetical protein